MIRQKATLLQELNQGCNSGNCLMIINVRFAEPGKMSFLLTTERPDLKEKSGIPFGNMFNNIYKQIPEHFHRPDLYFLFGSVCPFYGGSE